MTMNFNNEINIFHSYMHKWLTYASCLLICCVYTACSSSNGGGTAPSNNGNKTIGVGKSIAYFDNFTYKGEDDYYNDNPLSNNDSYYNPILPGWHSDPSICTNGNGDYFLVTSTFCYYPGVPIFHSKDLVNWTQIGNVLTRPSQLINLDNQGISGGIFAPTIRYNANNQTYYMITLNVGGGNFFVTAVDPYSSWSDPVYLNDVKGIDPSFFFDDNGKAYIVDSDNPDGTPEYDGQRAIRLHVFDINKNATVGQGKVIVNKGAHPEDNPIWLEGPHLYKIKGKYYLMCAEGGTGPQHSEVVFRSDSISGPYVSYENNPILTQRNLDWNRSNPITCAGHADLVQTKEGDWQSVFLACRPINNNFENLGRETFMMPVKWSDDGYPYMTQGNDIVPMIEERNGVVRDSDVTFGNFVKVDNFSSYNLGVDWMTLRSSATDLYSLSEEPGYLALHCSTIKASDKNTPAFICRRMQHQKFECTTKVIFNSTDVNDNAGLLLFKDEAHQYFLSINNSGKNKNISVNRIGANGSTTQISQKAITNDNSPIYLKVVSEGICYDFYYSLNGKDWNTICQNVDAKYLSSANCGGFTGTTIGMYAVKE